MRSALLTIFLAVPARLTLPDSLCLGSFVSESVYPGVGHQETRTQSPTKNSQRCWAAEEAFSNAQFERAAGLARLCLLQDGQSSETYKLLALSSYMLQRLDDFQTGMEKALALNPADGGAHYHLGRFFYEQKQYREALNRFNKATELDPENQKAYYFRGLCRQASGDEEGAAGDFRKSIELIERAKINYGWPFADLGELFILRGEFEKGLSWIYRATRNDPTLPYTHFAYARALLRKETSPEIEGSLQKAIKLDPGYAQAYYLLARYYSKTGDKERAKSTFEKFEQLRKNPVPSPFGLRR